MITLRRSNFSKNTILLQRQELNLKTVKSKLKCAKKSSNKYVNMSSEDEYSTNAQSFILKIDHPDQLIIAVNRSKDLDDTASPFPISPFSILVHNGSLEVVWMSSESNSYYLYICLQSFRLSVFSSFCLFGFLSFFLL